MNAKKFWDKVHECKHDNSVWKRSLFCDTEYCSASEYYCPDCRVYEVECLCGYRNGFSGWSEKRMNLKLNLKET